LLWDDLRVYPFLKARNVVCRGFVIVELKSLEIIVYPRFESLCQ
jgi:hypothetical protein